MQLSRALAVAALVGALLLSACGQRPPAEGQPITIALSSNAIPYGGLFIAEQAGLLEKHGLLTRIVVMDSGNAATTALIAGSAQFAASGPTEVLAARVRNQDIVILANLYRGLSATVVLGKSVAERLAAAAAASPEEKLRALDGLRIAVPSPTSSYAAPVKAGAAAVGANVRFVYMAQSTMPAALSRNAIDGFVAAPPYSDVALDAGTGVTWIDGPKAEFPAAAQPTATIVLQTTRAYAEANPGQAEAMQAMLADLAQYIKADPAGARAALGRAYPTLEPAAVDKVFVDHAANWTHPLLSEADITQEIALGRAISDEVGAVDQKTLVGSILWKR